MTRRGPWRVFLAATIGGAITFGPSHRADAADVACSAAKNGALLAEAIGIVADSSLPAGVLDAALAAWRTCPASGTGFPEFAAAARERSVVTVRYVAGNSQEGRCGYFAGSEIVLFASARDRLGRAVPCGSLATNLAHELGHVLGLKDAPLDPRCRQYVMSGDDTRPGRERLVQPQECAAADTHWLTPAEGAVLAHSWRRIDGGSNLWLAADLDTARSAPPTALAMGPASSMTMPVPSRAPGLGPDAFP